MTGALVTTERHNHQIGRWKPAYLAEVVIPMVHGTSAASSSYGAHHGYSVPGLAWSKNHVSVSMKAPREASSVSSSSGKPGTEFELRFWKVDARDLVQAV